MRYTSEQNAVLGRPTSHRGLEALFECKWQTGRKHALGNYHLTAACFVDMNG
jgi:hypothetical protein